MSRGLLGVALLLLLCPAGAQAEEVWGPFRGTVIDVETGQPLPGVVVFADWIERWNALIETHTRFYDAREVLTGPDGTFEIPRLPRPLWPFRRIDGPSVRVFAPGYAEHRRVVTPPTGEALIDPTVIEMRPLKTREERLRQLSRSDPPTSVPLEKQCLLRHAQNVEAENLQLSPLPECPK
jgi:hypothetical protein